jgi:hypothetical protein
LKIPGASVSGIFIVLYSGSTAYFYIFVRARGVTTSLRLSGR